MRVGLLIAGAVVLGRVIFLLGLRRHAGSEHATSSAAPKNAAPPEVYEQAARQDLPDLLRRVLARLRQAPDASALAELRAGAAFAKSEELLAAIRAFIATGEDAPTGESFTLEGGTLVGAPTLRVLLLDLLARYQLGPEAVAISREMLEQKTSSDEWAIALRNVGRLDAGARAYLIGKTHDMLANAAWRAAPSDGFLEAFDVAVFTGDASFVPVFSELAQKGSPMLGRAAGVALDRLSEASPLAVMQYLNAHPTDFADRASLRADYYAKADLADTGQRAAVEAHLAQTDVSIAEKAKILDGLTAPASIISETLLTQPDLRRGASGSEAAVRTAYEAWLAAGRFPELSPELARLLRAIE